MKPILSENIGYRTETLQKKDYHSLFPRYFTLYESVIPQNTSVQMLLYPKIISIRGSDVFRTLSNIQDRAFGKSIRLWMFDKVLIAPMKRVPWWNIDSWWNLLWWTSRLLVCSFGEEDPSTNFSRNWGR